MKDTTIPQLRQKFRLLTDYGHFNNLEEIAKALGKQPGTIKTWADGGERWETGRVAPASFDGVIRLFGEAIARHHDIRNVESVIKGRTIDLEALFKPPSSVRLAHLIKREAVIDSGKLIRTRTRPIGAVETSNTLTQEPDVSIGQGKYFRIIFNSVSSASNILVLQNARQNWGFVPAALNSNKPQILVPGYNEDGLIADMRENDWTDINRFIAFQTDVPFPQNLLVAVKEGLAPDSVLIQELAEFYCAQPFDRRNLFVLSVMVDEKIDE